MSEGGSRVTGYRYRHRAYSDGTAGDWSDYSDLGFCRTCRRVTITGFDDSTTDDIELEAVNAHGAGPGAVFTVHAKPPAPTNLNLVHASPATSALTFSWDPVTGTGASIRRYRWEYSSSRGSNWGWADPDTAQVTVTGLAPRTSHHFRVQAENVWNDGARVGDWSTTITEVTRTSASVRALTPSPLTVPALQDNDDTARLRITLSSGGSWDAGAAASHFSASGLPGVKVDSVLPPSGGSIDVVIDYDGSDLTSNATLVFRIAPEAHDDTNTIVATIPVTAVLSTVSVANIRVTEGTKPDPNFLVRIDPAPNQAVTLKWAMRSESGDTATPLLDYGPYISPLLSHLNLNPRTLHHSRNFYVVIDEDSIAESDETFTFRLAELSANARFAGGGATLVAKGTIVDNDRKAGAPTGFSAVASPTVPGIVDLKWSVPADPGMLNGRAATIGEYQFRTATTPEGLHAARWFSTGSTSTTFDVFANRDQHFGDHHFQVRAITGVTDANGAPAGVVSRIASATVRLPFPTVPGALRATQRTESAIQIIWSASTYSGSEDLVYTSERRTSGSGNPWVEAGTGADTHRRFGGLGAGTDYDFRVRACAAGTDNCGGYAQGTFATLAAAAAAVATLALEPVTINESGPNNAATLRATLDTTVSTTTTLNVSAAPPGVVTLDGTTLTIPAGETESTGSGIRITAVDDEVASGADARVTLSATAPAGVGAPALVTLTVAEDDTAPDTIALSVHPASVPEDGSATQVTVSAAFPLGSATLPSATTVTVRVGTSGDSATRGTDYAQVGDLSVTIPAGRTRGTRTFTFTPIRDADDSEGPETVSVTGSTAGFTVEPAALTVADRAPIDSGSAILSVADAGAPEGEPLTFTVTVAGRTLDRALELVATPSSEPGDTASAGTDYETAEQSIRITAGQRSATFAVATVQDDEAEADETFTVTLSPRAGTSLPAGVRIARATATGTIVSDDLAAHRLPLVVPADHAQGLRSITRLVNRSDTAGEVRIEAFDDAGALHGPVTLSIGANEAVQFSSADLEEGNAGKGLSGGVGDGEGDWRLKLTSTLDLQVLGYVLTTDGFLATMHDVVSGGDAGHRVPFFNPGRNRSLASRLRVVNPGAEAAEVTIEGIDARGEAGASAVVLSLPAGAARTVSARDLESGDAEGLTGALGTGSGKWQLVITADRPVAVMSLLASATGYLSNLSTAPEPAAEGADDAPTVHRLPLVVPAGHAMGLRSITRLVNRSDAAGTVRIEAHDDDGILYGPVTLALDANEAVQFSSADLEEGNAGKGLSGGVGDGEGEWRLEITSTLDLQVLGYVLTTDGFLATMHDVVPGGEAGHRVPFFNPGRNQSLASRLRLVNPGAEAAEVSIEGVDAQGDAGESAVVLSLPAGASRTLSAQALESGEAEGLTGALGTGSGKWQLVVTADRPVVVMSLLASATGYLSNLSTAPGATAPARVR